MSDFEGKARVVTFSPAITPAAYAAGDQVGVAVELPNALDASGDTGTILSCVVLDKNAQAKGLSVLLFNSQPTVASADNAAVNITDAEMAAKYLGRIVVEDADYSTTAASADATKIGIGLLVQAAAGTNSLWALVQMKSAATYASATDLVIKLGIVQD